MISRALQNFCSHMNAPVNGGDKRGLGSIPVLEKMPWRSAWPPTPVFLPGESYGQWSLAGYSPGGHKELDMTKATKHTSILATLI